jgi:hypothetical protein
MSKTKYMELLKQTPAELASTLIKTEQALTLALEETGRLGKEVIALKNDLQHEQRLLNEAQPVTDEMVEDFAVTAIESGSYGIGYWVDQVRGLYYAPTDGKVVLSEVPLRSGGTIQLRLTEDVSEGMRAGHILLVSKVDLINGIRAYARLRGVTTHRLHQEHDANDADNVFQLAIFKEIIFG